MSATHEFIDALRSLKSGDLALLRSHAGQGLDASVDGFDLFAGVWWPLREKSPRAPRREVAWLIAKLYAAHPLEHAPDEMLACRLRRCEPRDEPAQKSRSSARSSFRRRFDSMLLLPLSRIEPELRWAMSEIGAEGGGVDWVRLTDDLSFWERESTRLRWAEQYLETNERGTSC